MEVWSFSLAAAVQGRPGMDERRWVADRGQPQFGTGQEGWTAGQRGNLNLEFWILIVLSS